MLWAFSSASSTTEVASRIGAFDERGRGESMLESGAACNTHFLIVILLGFPLALVISSGIVRIGLGGAVKSSSCVFALCDSCTPNPDSLVPVNDKPNMGAFKQQISTVERQRSLGTRTNPSVPSLTQPAFTSGREASKANRLPGGHLAESRRRPDSFPTGFHWSADAADLGRHSSLRLPRKRLIPRHGATKGTPGGESRQESAARLRSLV